MKILFRKSKLAMQSLTYVEARTWNKLLNDLKIVTSINCFKLNFKKYYFNKLSDTEGDISS